MIVLGLCGQSGAGKTTVLESFVSFGATVCDCDRISREVMGKDTPCSAEVIQVFGQDICRDGEIDRKALGKLVFFDPEKLASLTEITHRYIKAEVYKRIDEARKDNVKLFVIDAPLLFESGLDAECDVTVAVTANAQTRIDRIMKRDGIDRELAEKRLESQLSEDELNRLASEVIVNDGTLEELKESVKKLAERRGLLK